MARPLKEGLDYYPRKVGIYDDPKVIDLIINCGYTGFVIWDYLIDKIYQNGYFYPWNNRSSPKAIAFKMSGGIEEGQVRETVEMCCRCGLFDGAVLTVCGILTSRGIQRRYCNAAADRRNKEVIADYWLLDESESAGFVKCTLKRVSPPNNPCKSPNNPCKSPSNAIEQSKAKDSRAKQIDIDGDDGYTRAGARESNSDFSDGNNVASDPADPKLTPEYLFTHYFGKRPTEAEVRQCQKLLDIRDHAVLEHAFQRAGVTDNKNLAYVLGILERYTVRGVKSIRDVADDDMRHAAAKK